MGWRKGKALGLKEDGCKEHVKVSTKSDRKGSRSLSVADIHGFYGQGKSRNFKKSGKY